MSKKSAPAGKSHDPTSASGGWMVFVCRHLPANEKTMSLRALCLCGEDKCIQYLGFTFSLM